MTNVEDNLEIVRRGLKAMQRRDVEAMLRSCDPEIEFVALVGQIEDRSYHGHDGVRRFFSDFTDAWDVWDPTPEHFESSGDKVLVTGRTRLRGKGSGVELVFEWGQVFRLRAGKVLWLQIYSDPAEARREFEGAGPALN